MTTQASHIHPEDLALHAMRLLDGEEASVVHEHLTECADCRREFMAAQGDLSVVAWSVPMEAPPAEARDRFLRQIARESRVVSIDRAHQPGNATVVPADKTGGSTLLPWLGWAVAAGLFLSSAKLYRDRDQLQTTVAYQSTKLNDETAQMATMTEDNARAKSILNALTDSNAMRVTLNTTPAAKSLPQGRAAYLAEEGTLVFIANNLAPLPLAKVYELWLIPANGAAPIPAGTFHPDSRGNASVIMPELPKGVTAKTFGVTIEAQGGATTPTLPIILAGS